MPTIGYVRVWHYPIMFIIVTMQMAVITLTVKDLFDECFMAKYFTYCERKIIMQEIFQEMESPERMVASPVHGFLSPNGVGKLGPLKKRSFKPAHAGLN